MRVETLTSLPERFAAGTTVKYTRSLDDYRADQGWSLKLALAGAVSRVFTAAVNANGRDFDFTLPASATGGPPLPPATNQLSAGVYTAVEIAIKGAEQYEVGGPWQIEVTPDILAVATTGAGDLESWYQQLRAALRARIAGRLQPGEDLAKIEFDGRAVELIPITGPDGCMELLDIVEAKLAALKAPGAMSVTVEMDLS